VHDENPGLPDSVRGVELCPENAFEIAVANDEGRS
jgi:hypothetical protein